MPNEVLNDPSVLQVFDAVGWLDETQYWQIPPLAISKLCLFWKLRVAGLVVGTVKDGVFVLACSSIIISLVLEASIQ